MQYEGKNSSRDYDRVSFLSHSISSLSTEICYLSFSQSARDVTLNDSICASLNSTNVIAQRNKYSVPYEELFGGTNLTRVTGGVVTITWLELWAGLENGSSLHVRSENVTLRSLEAKDVDGACTISGMCLGNWEAVNFKSEGVILSSGALCKTVIESSGIRVENFVNIFLSFFPALFHCKVDLTFRSEARCLNNSACLCQINLSFSGNISIFKTIYPPTLAHGYDHTFVLREPGSLRHVTSAVDPASGRRLDVATTQPGLQLYTANMLDGTVIGSGGRLYRAGDAVCFEAQGFPDAPNRAEFPSTTLRPGEVFTATTTYRFSAD